MKTKLIALLIATVLALGGVASMVMYARGADARAFGDAELVPVLVVSQPVPEGSPADRLVGSIETREVPKALVPDDAVTDLTTLGVEVTNTDLVPGETLLASRFGTEVKPVSKTDLPTGMQRFDLLLENPRVPSGLEAGDIVGVLASISVTGDGGVAVGRTKMLLSKVRVIGLEDGVAGGEGDGSVVGGVRVTLALTTHQAEIIANTAEFGTIWLTAQTSTTDITGSKTASLDGVLK